MRVRARRRGDLVHPAPPRDRDARHPRPERPLDSNASSGSGASPQVASRTRGTGATTSIASSPRGSTGRACSSSATAGRSSSRTRSASTRRRRGSRSSASFPRVFSPDSDGSRDRVTATYRIDERARAVMLVDGRQRVQSKFRALEGKLVWFGRDQRPRRSGRERTRSGCARSTARGTAPCARARCPFASASSSSRASGSRRSRASGSRCACAPTPTRTGGCSRDGEGSGRREVLVLRAPDEPGAYALYVIVGGRAARAAVEVTAPE